VAGWLLLILFI